MSDKLYLVEIGPIIPAVKRMLVKAPTARAAKTAVIEAALSAKKVDGIDVLKLVEEGVTLLDSKDEAGEQEA
jgi:hypothetical protein